MTEIKNSNEEINENEVDKVETSEKKEIEMDKIETSEKNDIDTKHETKTNVKRRSELNDWVKSIIIAAFIAVLLIDRKSVV